MQYLSIHSWYLCFFLRHLDVLALMEGLRCGCFDNDFPHSLWHALVCPSERHLVTSRRSTEFDECLWCKNVCFTGLFETILTGPLGYMNTLSIPLGLVLVAVGSASRGVDMSASIFLLFELEILST